MLGLVSLLFLRGGALDRRGLREPRRLCRVFFCALTLLGSTKSFGVVCCRVGGGAGGRGQRDGEGARRIGHQSKWVRRQAKRKGSTGGLHKDMSVLKRGGGGGGFCIHINARQSAEHAYSSRQAERNKQNT